MTLFVVTTLCFHSLSRVIAWLNFSYIQAGNGVLFISVWLNEYRSRVVHNLC